MDCLEHSLCFQRLRLEHLDEIAHTLLAWNAHTWTENNLRAAFHAGDFLYVVEEAQALIGILFFREVVDDIELLEIMLVPEQRGQGKGRAMLQFLIEFSKTRQMQRIILEVRESNHLAQNLYRACRFEEIGIRKNYYPSPTGREDARVFALSLTD